MALFNDRHAEYDILDQSLCACDGLFPLPVEEKAFSGLPQAPQKRPSGFQGAEQLLNLLKPNWFPLDFRELPIPNNPGYRNGLGLITQDTGPVRGRKDTSHRQAREICDSRFEFVRL